MAELTTFTASKGAKSATFRIFDSQRRYDREDVEGNDAPALILWLDLQTADDFGSDPAWIRDRGQWPPKVRQVITTFEKDTVIAAYTELGDQTRNSVATDRAMEDALLVKCFDIENGTTSVIN